MSNAGQAISILNTLTAYERIHVHTRHVMHSTAGRIKLGVMKLKRKGENLICPSLAERGGGRVSVTKSRPEASSKEITYDVNR